MTQPLFEVFGYPYNSMAPEAVHARKHKLCPFQAEGTKCTKVSVTDPLGVCSVSEDGIPAITCPTRFKERWLIARDAASFFFGYDAKFEKLPEVRIKTSTGESAGNIDVVLAQMDEDGEVLDFGSIEIQAVYISGNVRNPFEEYMADPKAFVANGFNGVNSPRPDYLSSSRKRLAPQMTMKGGIFKAWGKKQAIVLHKGFFDTLPELKAIPAAEKSSADILWLIYDLQKHLEEDRYILKIHKRIYTDFETALKTITTGANGPVDEFKEVLKDKFKKLKKGQESTEL